MSPSTGPERCTTCGHIDTRHRPDTWPVRIPGLRCRAWDCRCLEYHPRILERST